MEFGTLLADPKGENPAGIELRNEPAFHAIERLLQPAARSERVNPDGSVNESAPQVDWQDIWDQIQDLAGFGRDLRLVVIATRAAANLEGFQGLAQGLQMIAQIIANHWDALHPALRDRDDPKAAALPRMNALRQLENDDNGLLGDLKFNAVLTPRGIGRVSGNDLAQGLLTDFEILNRAASGLSQAEKDAILASHSNRRSRVTSAVRALAAEESERAAELSEGLSAALSGIAAISAALNEKGNGAGDLGFSVPALTEFLDQCKSAIESGIAHSAGEPPPSAETAEPAPGPATVANASAAEARPAAPTPGTIGSRADVEKSLDAIIAFYERTEPSSPIPHLARRLRRMVAMDFVQLMEEVAPSGLKEFRLVAGMEESKKK
ncbi:type VI secretion system protein TssA [Ruegeria aquimaris]|uniref:Type VI secretion system ImpA family N-terminal domain-containing protein n=1 Tax=Ruegeria aquimaris TaxID=2984333 RepID=A0ABT3ANQ3_9RHOB|nr:type VI secretion system ImpA family N-terminal domain-containing protein [Ruegeria sp. XHP0148]MCV2890316.1 type VI secretion system ImpA family N-terminal domain-containing protein [Ruegeria sp. XHP0148]